MSTLEILERAIDIRKSISFVYIRPGKTRGMRTGNPHAVFIKRLKSGEERIYVHIWQTSGATDSGKELPSWRPFLLENLSEVVIQEAEPSFEVADGYNPSFYEFPIRKI